VSDPLRSLEDYELFIYSLAGQFSAVRRSTVVLIRKGATLAEVQGDIHFDGGLRVAVFERLRFERQPGRISGYGYEIWLGEEKLFWYDSQPHPADPLLQENHPHHKHVPPDIKHHRLPALNMSFTKPNIPEIVREVLNLLPPYT
jgi:hypothetical protein